MGNRLSRIYTRTGDDGTTGLGDGERVRKDDARVEAYGTIDELNSVLGMLAPLGIPADLDELVASLQQKLFDLGGELCIPGRVVIESSDVLQLEQELDRLNAALPPLREFVLPGGNTAAAACHLARAICRRAERRTITMAESATVNSHSIRYLNRLSDLLFVLARTINLRNGHAEVLWASTKLAKSNQPPDEVS